MKQILKPINHICFSVRNLNDPIHLYRGVLLGKLLLTGKRTIYFGLVDLWIILNEEKDIPHGEIHLSHIHIAFIMDDSELKYRHQRLKDNNVNILEGRVRDIRDRQSIYFTGPNGHKLELRTSTPEDRLSCYKEAKPRITFYK